jgi:hypothetical protein
MRGPAHAPRISAAVNSIRDTNGTMPAVLSEYIIYPALHREEDGGPPRSSTSASCAPKLENLWKLTPPQHRPKYTNPTFAHRADVYHSYIAASGHDVWWVLRSNVFGR